VPAANNAKKTYLKKKSGILLKQAKPEDQNVTVI
jgi:hypothetical protein